LRLCSRAPDRPGPTERTFSTPRVLHLARFEWVSTTRAPPAPLCTTFALVDTFPFKWDALSDVFLIDATCQAHRRGRHIRGVDACYTGSTIMQRYEKKSTTWTISHIKNEP
jgi:hypothetical protein